MVGNLNDNDLVDKIRTEGIEEIANKINGYFIESKITTTESCTVCIISSRDVNIKSSIEEDAEEPKVDDNFIIALRSKTKLSRKRYRFIAFKFLKAKIELREIEDMKKMLMTQNSSNYKGMKDANTF